MTQRSLTSRVMICISWEYLVNKPLSAAGISEDCPRLRDCPKNEQLAEKRSFQGNCEILRTIFQPRALFCVIPASRKGVYLFYSPPNNFSRRTHVDCSCIFCRFFRVSRYGIVNQLFIDSSLASAKRFFFWFSLTNLKFSVTNCWFLRFPSVEIKSDDGYQIGRRISSVSKIQLVVYHQCCVLIG